jgi:hypothetical protein
MTAATLLEALRSRPGRGSAISAGSFMRVSITGSRILRDVRLMRVIGNLHELVDLATGELRGFLRYSRGPDADAEEGPSRDYEADVEMTGWSVTTLRPESWWTRPAEEWVARRICKYLDLGGDARGC